MNRKAAIVMTALSFAALTSAGVQANEANAIVVQTMAPIVVKASFLPSASAVKLERIVVTAKRDLSDLQPEIQPEALARTESKVTGASGSASL